MDLDLLDFDADGCGCLVPGPIRAILCGLLCLVWAVLGSVAIIETAHLTYALPPGPGEVEGNSHDYWHMPILAMTALSAFAGVLGLGSIALGIYAAMSRSRTAVFSALTGVGGLVLTTVAVVIATSMDTPVF